MVGWTDGGDYNITIAFFKNSVGIKYMQVMISRLGLILISMHICVLTIRLV